MRDIDVVLTFIWLPCFGAQLLGAQATSAAVTTDPPVDKQFPPVLTMFTVPSHGVELDAWLYFAGFMLA